MVTKTIHADSGPQGPMTPVRQLLLPNGLPFTQYVLTNGLTIYVIENHSAPVFTYETWFKVGSKDEKLDPKINSTGLAHLFEHMMFRGTPRYPDGKFDEVLAENGVNDENATTWVDRTNYYESLPSSQLALAMELESDRMANLALDQTLLDTERSAVVGELKMDLDDPDSVAYYQLYGAAFRTHPYQYTTIGTEKEIQSFTLAQANYFYKTYYSPSNASLLVTGDVDPQIVALTVQKFYGSIPAVDVKHAVATPEPAQTAERKVAFTHPQLQQTTVTFGYHVPGVKDADFPALFVLQSAFTNGQASLLELNWVNAGMSISVTGTVNQFADPGLFIIATEIQPGTNPSDITASFDKILADIATRGAEGLVDRAKNQLLLQLHSQLEQNESMASFLGEYIATAGDPVFGFNLVSGIEKVTAADLVRVAAKYLVPTNRTIVVGTPQ